MLPIVFTLLYSPYIFALVFQFIADDETSCLETYVYVYLVLISTLFV